MGSEDSQESISLHMRNIKKISAFCFHIYLLGECMYLRIYSALIPKTKCFSIVCDNFCFVFFLCIFCFFLLFAIENHFLLTKSASIIIIYYICTIFIRRQLTFLYYSCYRVDSDGRIHSFLSFFISYFFFVKTNYEL